MRMTIADVYSIGSLLYLWVCLGTAFWVVDSARLRRAVAWAAGLAALVCISLSVAWRLSELFSGMAGLLALTVGVGFCILLLAALVGQAGPLLAAPFAVLRWGAPEARSRLSEQWQKWHAGGGSEGAPRVLLWAALVAVVAPWLLLLAGMAVARWAGPPPLR